MNPTLAPVKVSPAIKTARWGIFIFGIFYGFTRHQSLKVYENIARPRRKEEIRKAHERKRAEDFQRTKNEVFQLGKDFEVTEFPDGWEKLL